MTNSQKQHPTAIDSHELTQAVTEGLSTRKIAERLGVGRTRVRNALVELGLDTAHPAVASRPDELNDAEWLRRRYIDDQASLSALGAELGCSQNTVSAALDQHGIVRREQVRYPELFDRD
jgi:transposase